MIPKITGIVIDGHESEFHVSEVKILVTDKENDTQYHINCTSEGVIMDRIEGDGDCTGTRSQMYDELFEEPD